MAEELQQLLVEALNKTHFALVLCSNVRAVLKITQKMLIEEYLEGVFDNLTKCLELVQRA